MKRSEPRLTLKQKRIFTLIITAAALIFTGLVGWFVGRPMLTFVSEPEKFRAWVDERGLWGRIAFVLMTIFQVVIAVIPGEPLEIGAGYAFGAVEGTVLCMIGLTIGGIIVFLLVRTVGIRMLELFFPIERIRSLKFLQNSRRVHFLTFLIFFLPGTPKDLVAYFVGLTEIKLSSWIFIASVARLPSVITSTLGGNALGRESYKAAAIVFAITLAVSGIGWMIYHFISKTHNEE